MVRRFWQQIVIQRQIDNWTHPAIRLINAITAGWDGLCDTGQTNRPAGGTVHQICVALLKYCSETKGVIPHFREHSALVTGENISDRVVRHLTIVSPSWRAELNIIHRVTMKNFRKKGSSMAFLKFKSLFVLFQDITE